jgi:hypothetical protein
MQGIEKQVAEEPSATIEKSESLQLSTIDRIRELRKKIKVGKIAAIGLAGLTGLLYVGANVYKPQLAEYILSSNYENATKNIQKDFPENLKPNTTAESKNSHLKTFVTPEGNIVHYSEKSAIKEEDLINGKGKVLIQFPGIDNSLPDASTKGFEKVVRVYYDANKMKAEEIKQQGVDVSTMINTEYRDFKKSSISTSFGGLVQSEVLPFVNFELSKTFAPFTGESNVVKAVTGLPIPISLFHPDKYNNVIKNADPKLEVFVSNEDRITGGADDLKRVYKNFKVQSGSSHTRLGTGKDFSQNKSDLQFPSIDKYTQFKQNQENNKIQLEKIDQEYNSKSFKIFSEIVSKLDNVDTSIISTIRKEFKQPLNNNQLFPIELNRFITSHPLSKSIVSKEFLMQHEKLYLEYTVAKQKIEEG